MTSPGSFFHVQKLKVIVDEPMIRIVVSEVKLNPITVAVLPPILTVEHRHLSTLGILEHGSKKTPEASNYLLTQAHEHLSQADASYYLVLPHTYQEAVNTGSTVG